MLEELFCAHRAELTAIAAGCAAVMRPRRIWCRKCSCARGRILVHCRTLAPASAGPGCTARCATCLWMPCAVPRGKPPPCRSWSRTGNAGSGFCRSGSPPPVGIAAPGGAGAIPQALPGRLHRSGTGKNVRFAACHRAHPAGQSPPILKPIIDGGINDAE